MQDEHFGQGLAAELVQQALDKTRADNLTATLRLVVGPPMHHPDERRPCWPVR